MKRIIAVVSGVLLAGTGAGAATAVEGGVVTNQPWVVTVDTGSAFCTAVAISDEWVLTAKHCELAPGGAVKYPTGSNGAYGANERVDRVIDSAADVSMAHVAVPHRLAVYPAVDLNYVPKAGDSATFYGIGGGGQQRALTVPVAGSGGDFSGGPTIFMRGTIGGARAGDSGGPALVDGKVVGVLYGTDGGNGTWASQLSGPATKSMIAKNTVGAITSSSGTVHVTVGSALFRANTRIVAWVNSAYAGELYAGTTYYSNMSTDGGDTITWNIAAKQGDRIQIGELPGRPGDSYPVSSAHLQATTVAGVLEGLTLTGSGVDVALANAFVSSTNRVMFWVNGAYVGEIYSGHVYYAGWHVSGNDTVVAIGARPGDAVQVTVNPGVPGGTPDLAQGFNIASLVR